jgi:hypothetical protein
MAAETLRRVGWSLIAVGLLDIALLVYGIANNLSYGSGFGVFAVAAGMFLLRQSMRTASVVGFFAAFFLPPAVVATVLNPLVVTIPIATELITVTLIVYVFWVYRRLTSPAVMEARRSAGVSARTPRLAFVAGVTFAVGWALIILMAQFGTK